MKSNWLDYWSIGRLISCGGDKKTPLFFTHYMVLFKKLPMAKKNYKILPFSQCHFGTFWPISRNLDNLQKQTLLF